MSLKNPKKILQPVEEEVDFTIFRSEYLQAYKAGLDMHNSCRLRHQKTNDLELRIVLFIKLIVCCMNHILLHIIYLT